MAATINISNSDYTNISPGDLGGIKLTGYSGTLPTSVDDIVSIEIKNDVSALAGWTGDFPIVFYDDPNSPSTGEVTYIGIDDSKTFAMKTGETWWFQNKEDPTQTKPVIVGLFLEGKQAKSVMIDGKNVGSITLEGKKFTFTVSTIDVTVTDAEIQSYADANISWSWGEGTFSTGGWSISHPGTTISASPSKIPNGSETTFTVTPNPGYTVNGGDSHVYKHTFNVDVKPIAFSSSYRFAVDRVLYNGAGTAIHTFPANINVIKQTNQGILVAAGGHVYRETGAVFSMKAGDVPSYATQILALDVANPSFAGNELLTLFSDASGVVHISGQGKVSTVGHWTAGPASRYNYSKDAENFASRSNSDTYYGFGTTLTQGNIQTYNFGSAIEGAWEQGNLDGGVGFAPSAHKMIVIPSEFDKTPVDYPFPSNGTYTSINWSYVGIVGTIAGTSGIASVSCNESNNTVSMSRVGSVPAGVTAIEAATNYSSHGAFYSKGGKLGFTDGNHSAEWSGITYSASNNAVGMTRSGV